VELWRGYIKPPTKIFIGFTLNSGAFHRRIEITNIGKTFADIGEYSKAHDDKFTTALLVAVFEELEREYWEANGREIIRYCEKYGI
jgi:hypothetical protein